MSASEDIQIPWTRHPVVDELIPPLSVEELRSWVSRPGGYEAALKYWESHEAAIQDASEDPLAHGFELPFWHDFRQLLARKDSLYALGGNGPGKTEIGGKLCIEALCRENGRKVLCIATNENSSKQLQQPALYKYLPAGLRSRNEMAAPQRREAIKKVKYTPAGGFTEGTFVLPNRSQCWFKTVRQYLDDPSSFEGPEYDLVWIDEPAPVALVDTLSYRVAKRRGKFLFTFTAVHGFDANCAKVLTGAKLVKSLPLNWSWRTTSVGLDQTALSWEARGGPDPRIKVPELDLAAEQLKGCPPGHMPYIMQPLDPSIGVIFLWTQWNVFLPRSNQAPAVPALFDKCAGKSQSIVRTRLFGWADKVSGCQYPQFTPDVHVIPVDKVPRSGTIYMAGDPATARSYFLLWVLVDERGRKFVYDESPRMKEGEWVGEDGGRGDGTRIFAGKGSKWYKGYIRAREREHRKQFGVEAVDDAELAVLRKGDPRGFAAAAAAADGGENLFELFAHDHASEDWPDSGPMIWQPAKVRQTIDLDLEKVNDELAWDERQPISVENEPQLYIAECCQNLIRAMLNWSPDQGKESPWKDPNDTLRYLFDEPLYYLDPAVPEMVGGGGWR